MFLAKLASDLNKPNGLTIVPETPPEIAKFLAPLPVGRIWGVGAKTNEILAKYNLRTIGDVQHAATDFLERILGSYGEILHARAFGIDHRAVQPESAPEKSMSQEHTFKEDCTDFPTIRAKLLEQCEMVAARLRRHGMNAGCAVLKLRFANFRTITRQMPVPSPTNSDRELRGYALQLLQSTRLEEKIQPVRLIGFGAANLVELAAPENALRQPSLFPEDNRKDEQLRAEQQKNHAIDQAIDELRQRFGRSSIHRG